MESVPAKTEKAIVEKLKAGEEVAHVARSLGISTTPVHRIRRKYNIKRQAERLTANR